MIQITDDIVNVGDNLTLECRVYGSQGGSTVWKGSAFSSDCEIILLHIRFWNGTSGVCNNGDITGLSIDVIDSESNNISNDSFYISQLVIVVQPEMIQEEVECIHDNGSVTESIGINNISILHKASHSPGADVIATMILKETRLPIIISISVVIILITLLLFTLFLLYGLRKKIWSISESV